MLPNAAKMLVNFFLTYRPLYNLLAKELEVLREYLDNALAKG
jgi:hypothetical protein